MSISIRRCWTDSRKRWVVQLDKYATRSPVVFQLMSRSLRPNPSPGPGDERWISKSDCPSMARRIIRSG